MDRRTFMTAATGVTAAAAMSVPEARAVGRARQGEPFRLKYAPHFGMFRHHAGEDVVDQLRFMADEGFRALEDNTMTRRSVAEQERIATAMEELGLEMGVFVANFGTAFGKQSFVNDDAAMRDNFLADLRTAVEVAQRVRARWMTIVLGDLNPRLDYDYQMANAIDMLRRGAEIFEPHGLVMVMEPLNPRDHPGMFLTKIAQAHALCRAVDSPAVKILNDLYHQQITEGNLIPNLDRAWSETAYIQVGDNPGRREPTTGEINYRNVFGHLHAKGFEGIVGMEHGNRYEGKDGERRLIDAYRWCDGF